jgi:hypothetical protein
MNVVNSAISVLSAKKLYYNGFVHCVVTKTFFVCCVFVL